jgi:hypothetical protein
MHEANFGLFGPGVQKSTTFDFVGTQSWIVRLRPGRYRYRSQSFSPASRSVRVPGKTFTVF